MSNSPAKYRMERIERLLDELKYEVTRGMMEREIDEQIGFRFVVPISRTYPERGVVFCEFITRPLSHFGMAPTPDAGPRLKLVSRENSGNG